MDIQPHHTNNLRPIIIRIEGSLPLATQSVKGKGDVVDGHPTRRVHDGQFGTKLVPAEVDERMATMDFCDGQQLSVITENPFPIRGATL
jgi:hypothetical protein